MALASFARLTSKPGLRNVDPTIMKRPSRSCMIWLRSLCLTGFVIFWLSGCDAHGGKTREQLATEFDASLASKNFETGASLLQAYEKRYGTADVWLPVMRGRLLLAQGRDADALAIFESIPRSSPHFPIAMQMAGQMHLRAGRLVPAETDFLAAIEADGNTVIPRRELIYIYGLQLRRRELREVFAGLAKVSPMSFGNVFHWCLTRGNDWEPQEIIDDMTKFLAADPSDRWSRIALARSLLRLSKRHEARKALEPLAADDPDAIALRAQIALDDGDPDLASKLLASGPRDHFDLAVMRARQALALAEFEKARDEFTIALKLDADNRDAIVGMARVLAALGETDEARSWLERSANLDKLATLVQKAASPGAESDLALIRALALGCESVGHTAEAKAWWNLVAARNPLDQEAQSALYRLNSVSKQGP